MQGTLEVTTLPPHSLGVCREVREVHSHTPSLPCTVGLGPRVPSKGGISRRVDSDTEKYVNVNTVSLKNNLHHKMPFV